MRSILGYLGAMAGLFLWAGPAGAYEEIYYFPGEGDILPVTHSVVQGEWMGWAGIFVVVAATLAGFLGWSRVRLLPQRGLEPGFELVSTNKPRTFIPLPGKYLTLEFVGEVAAAHQLRVPANLGKVSLSIRRNGYLLEDKNYRNVLLVNRRRVRRTLLKDGDLLDVGELTLVYRDIRVQHHASTSPGESHQVEQEKAYLRFHRPRGPIRKGIPMLIPHQMPNRVYYMTKNMMFIGRSESNDLVVKAANIHLRHAKILRVGGRYKLLDLALAGSTFVNNRRVEQKFLKDGDELAFDLQKFRFQLVTRPLKEFMPVSFPDRFQDALALNLPKEDQEEGLTEEQGEEPSLLDDPEEIHPSVST
ncbi:MAG: FHA domain-containing protein [Deltaproteobacteria bacterium]|nr:FHA domain-containing protein [Deltaproteobacteria bacterium]